MTEFTPEVHASIEELTIDTAQLYVDDKVDYNDVNNFFDSQCFKRLDLIKDGDLGDIVYDACITLFSHVLDHSNINKAFAAIIELRIMYTEVIVAVINKWADPTPNRIREDQVATNIILALSAIKSEYL